jgi:hypothetical protein
MPWFCQTMAGKLRSRIRWRQLRGHRLSASGFRRGRSPGQLTLSTWVPPFRLYTVVHSGGPIIHRDQVVTVERRTDSRNAAAKDMCTRWVRDAAERRVTSDWRCDLTATACDETLEVRFSVSGSRSPLFVRLTETACCAVLAAPGVLTAAGSAPTIRPTAIATAITLLRARGGEALLLDVEKLLSFLSISAPH